MKKIVFLLACCMFFTAGFAQIQRQAAKKTATDSLRHTKGHTKENMKALHLSKEQKGQLKEMKRENKAAKETIENDAGLTDVQKKGKIKALKKERSAKMKTVLTTEQQSSLKQMRKNKRGDQ